MGKVNSVSVVGLGKLGLCTAACFASKGFNVIGVDVDIDKIKKINKGISPITETNLQGLMNKTRNRLKATADYDEAILNSDVSFIVVATPSLADGSFSNEYLEKAVHKIAESLKKKKDYHVVVVTSTVMPQTTEKAVKSIVEKVSGKKCGKDFGLAYNPEFIALGSVIHDFLNSEMILIGEMNKKDGDILEKIYRKTCDSNPKFARMSPVNAEITKIALNCYVTTKITFANSLAGICEKVRGADALIVSTALGMDSRVGSRYIRPGLGFGGPCFPRDNQAFAAFARIVEAQAKLAETVDQVNQDQIIRMVEKIKGILSGIGKDRKNAKIAILGLSYKPNTPIIEDSHALNITQFLANEGFKVSVYDPQAMDNARSVLGDTVKYSKNEADCLTGADLGVITVPWASFKKINFKKINKNIVLLDCWHFLDKESAMRIEFLGRG
ncbi:MAG: nucleotide sugar dehydrogenase [Candidatus Omnitrophota bacterium]